MKLLGKIVWLVILPVMVIVVGWIVLRNADAFQFQTDTGYLITVGQIGKTWWFRVGFFLHVFAAVPVVVIGWIQFWKKMQTDHQKWHRWIGKAYVYLILFGAAPGGLIIAMGAAGGISGRVCFVVMALLWAYFTYRAVLRIRSGNIAGHQADMRRSYALSFAAVTLRIWMYLIGGVIEWQTPTAYAFCAWMCWVPNLLLLELWARLESRTTRLETSERLST